MRISDWSSDVCSSDLDDEKKRARETGEDAQAVPFLKRFTVFNAQQCENLPEELAVVAPPPLPGLIEPRIEALIAATGIDFRIGGNRAYYAPGPDYVMVPPPQAFFEPLNWSRTGPHEMGHATGPHSRPNPNGNTSGRDRVSQIQ